MSLSSSFPHCLEQRLNGTEYPKGKDQNGLSKPKVEYSLTGVTLYARIKDILWKYLVAAAGTYSWWRPPCLQVSCQADWILMLFWISTNVIQRITTAKLRFETEMLFSHALCSKVFILKIRSCYQENTWSRGSALRTYTVKEWWELLQ